MKLETIVPWGRTLAEYKAMFLIDEHELKGSILGCGDGPASFNCELRELGTKVVSIDPTYQFTKEQIASRIDIVADEVMVQVKENQADFIWKNIADPDELYSIRMKAMQKFLEDYKRGKEEGRYRFEMLPKLSFEDNSFDLALSSHFLLLYSEHLDLEFHLSAILEMLRVAREVRIFPIITLKGKGSTHLDAIMMLLNEKGYTTKIVATDYEFQKGGNKMLKIVKG